MIASHSLRINILDPDDDRSRSLDSINYYRVSDSSHATSWSLLESKGTMSRTPGRLYWSYGSVESAELIFLKGAADAAVASEKLELLRSTGARARALVPFGAVVRPARARVPLGSGRGSFSDPMEVDLEALRILTACHNDPDKIKPLLDEVYKKHSVGIKDLAGKVATGDVAERQIAIVPYAVVPKENDTGGTAGDEEKFGGQLLRQTIKTAEFDDDGVAQLAFHVVVAATAISATKNAVCRRKVKVVRR